MELPDLKTLSSRLLAASLLAGTLWLSVMERSSPIAQALRDRRPLMLWLALEEEGKGTPHLFLAVYQSGRRSLDLVYIPEAARTGGKGPRHPLPEETTARRMAEAAGERLSRLVPAWREWSGLPLWREKTGPFADAPPLEAREWLLRRTHGLKFWVDLTRHRPDPSWTALDVLLLALELRRLRPESLRPAWLAPDENVGPIFGRYLSASPRPAPSGRVTVEVLNSTTRSGIASQAKNILRLNGADVMSVGNAERPRTVSLVIDRTGIFDNAAAVSRMLGCPQARALTQVDLKRLVDVTVVLAEDCPLK